MEKTVCITGASSGFGMACAHIYAKNGYKLILSARRKDRLETLKEKLSAHTQVYTDILDVRDNGAVTQFVANLPDTFNTIDILINNAGLALGVKPADEAPLEDWETMIDTNIKGIVYLTKAILPNMVTHNAGHIVNIGSIAGTWPYRGGNVYGATKAFVKQFSNNLRADLLEKNIRVTNIEPGLAQSEFSLVRFKGDKEKADNIYQGTKPLLPQDIADIIFWVTSVPEHININSVEVMPTCQAVDSLKIHRTE